MSFSVEDPFVQRDMLRIIEGEIPNTKVNSVKKEKKLITHKYFKTSANQKLSVSSINP